jgi:hypothetical protein
VNGTAGLSTRCVNLIKPANDLDSPKLKSRPISYKETSY